MSPITSIGEIGVYVSGEGFLLRPTLRAMASIGEPKEIVEVFASVFGPKSWFQDLDALSVLRACSEGFEPADVIGHVDLADNKIVYTQAGVPREHLVPLARELLKHGVVGDVKPRNSGEETGGADAFEAREYVSLGVAHLGMSERDVWDMSMTSLVLALRAKFPEGAGKGGPGERAPTKEQHTKTMDWFDQVAARRKQRATG